MVTIKRGGKVIFKGTERSLLRQGPLLRKGDEWVDGQKHYVVPGRSNRGLIPKDEYMRRVAGGRKAARSRRRTPSFFGGLGIKKGWL